MSEELKKQLAELAESLEMVRAIICDAQRGDIAELRHLRPLRTGLPAGRRWLVLPLPPVVNMEITRQYLAHLSTVGQPTEREKRENGTDQQSA